MTPRVRLQFEPLEDRFCPSGWRAALPVPPHYEMEIVSSRAETQYWQRPGLAGAAQFRSQHWVALEIEESDAFLSDSRPVAPSNPQTGFTSQTNVVIVQVVIVQTPGILTPPIVTPLDDVEAANVVSIGSGHATPYFFGPIASSSASAVTLHFTAEIEHLATPARSPAVESEATNGTPAPAAHPADNSGSTLVVTLPPSKTAATEVAAQVAPAVPGTPTAALAAPLPVVANPAPLPASAPARLASAGNSWLASSAFGALALTPAAGGTTIAADLTPYFADLIPHLFSDGVSVAEFGAQGIAEIMSHIELPAATGNLPVWLSGWLAAAIGLAGLGAHEILHRQRRQKAALPPGIEWPNSDPAPWEGP